MGVSTGAVGNFIFSHDGPSLPAGGIGSSSSPDPAPPTLDVPNAFGHRLGTRLDIVSDGDAAARVDTPQHHRRFRSLHAGADESVTTITSSPVAVLMS